MFYGDNLNILKKYPDNSIDLIYLDPPFNSNRDCNILFQDVIGRPITHRVKAFEDTWNMDIEKWDFIDRMTFKLDNDSATTLKNRYHY